MIERMTYRRTWQRNWVRSRDWFLAAVLCCISPHVLGQDLKPVAERIVIESTWAGLNPEMPFHTRIVIEKDGAAYRLTGGHNKSHYTKPLPEQAFPAQAIAPQQVARLVDALEAPVQPSIDLRDMAPAIDHVQRQIDDVLEEAKISTPSTGLGAKVLAWRENLRNPRVLAETLTKGFDVTHTDDAPLINVEVTLSNGMKLTAKSRSQHYLMLPWANAQGNLTYSANISHALHALLPNEATNKKRLEGTLDDSELENMLDYALIEPIERLQAESEVPSAVRALDENFKVLSVSFESWKGRPHLQADLQLPNGPTNLFLSTRLPLTGKLIANQSDIPRVRQMLELVASSPALGKHIRSMPNVDFHISDDFGWVWLNPRTVAQFLNQMQQMKKLPELRSRPSLMRGAVLVEEGDLPVYWIVLADRRSVIWKQAAPTANKSTGGSCASIPMADSDPVGVNDLCLGTVYGVDGREQ